MRFVNLSEMFFFLRFTDRRSPRSLKLKNPDIGPYIYHIKKFSMQRNYIIYKNTRVYKNYVYIYIHVRIYVCTHLYPPAADLVAMYIPIWPV